MKQSWFVRGDIDGFFGLFIDNMLQLMLIFVLCTPICGLPAALVTGRILPAAAISILLGNLFYSWQAWRLMKKTGRSDVTALPYGINTPSLIAYIVLIMGPIYHKTGDYTLAWYAGIFACFLSGIMETAGAFVGDWLRRNTPRAALLSALAGVAITFIAVGFIFQLFALPAIAIIPMMLILITYAARIRLPLGIPGGLLAVAIGVAIAWILRALNLPSFEPSQIPYTFDIHSPKLAPLKELFDFFISAEGWKYMAIIFPMGLFNIIGSLQNLESAEAAGDRYETRPSLLANGIGSLVAALFGSAFPTTIYIGHPGWKAMGARAAYSVLNGVIITFFCLIGGITLVLKVVPLEATLGILLWIGIIISAQAFETVPRRHALAVAFGLIPALAAWAFVTIDQCLQTTGTSLFEAAAALTQKGLYVHGVIALNQGFILTSMIFAAILVFIIDHDFLKAAGWTLAAAILSMIGLIHGYELLATGVQNKFCSFAFSPTFKFDWAAPEFAMTYAFSALILLILHFSRQNRKSTKQEESSPG